MINIFEPNIGNESVKLLQRVFESKWLGRGEVVDEFEKELAFFLKCDRNALHTVASCSDAIFTALRVLKLRCDRNTIAMPTNSFPVLLSACKLIGFEIDLVDIDKNTGLICLEALAKSNKSYAAVFYTNYGNVALHGDQVRQVVDSDTKIYVDNACALGAFWKDGSFVGSEADFCCFSFDAMKLVVCGEGGCAYFPDIESLDLFKSLSYLGLPPSKKSGLDSAKNNSNWWEYNIKYEGMRSVFTNINASIGLPELRKVNLSLDRKREIFEIFKCTVSQLSYLRMNEDNIPYKSSNYFFSVQLEKRDTLAKYLLDNSIYCTLRYSPLNKMDLWAGTDEFPNSDYFFSRTLNIPIHPALSNDDVANIILSLKKFGS